VTPIVRFAGRRIQTMIKRSLTAFAYAFWLVTGICTASTRGPSDPAELEAFVDQLFARHMAATHTPGAVFVLVKDGRVMFMKGYGLASLEKKTPVVPERTLFRVASISKLFTATAIMQLSERGKLDLHKDINRYLRAFQLKNNYPRPVTLADVLTHTAGFDGESVGIVARSEREIVPLGEHLARWMPPRVMPPGETWSYSNYGLALAGYVAETASGTPFPQYIDENILQPLGMTRSSFLLPPELAPDLAIGYNYASGKYLPQAYYSMNVGPCGALVTTAADIARFMITHLHEGQYGESRILREETAREMHATHFRPSPGFDGMAYGFVESSRRGQRRLEHSGGLPGFQSLMTIVPTDDIGYFASATNNGRFFLPDVFRELEDRYWPATPLPAKATPVDTRSDAGRYAGSYRFNVYSRTTMGKIEQLVQPHVLTVTANADGTLSTNAFFSHPSGTWFEVRPAVFQEAGNEDKMAFRADDHGRVMHALMEPEAFDKEAWYDWRPLHCAFIAICAALFLSACAGWPVAALVRRIRRRRHPLNPVWRNATLLLGTVCALNLVYPPLLGVTIDRYHRDFGAGIPLAFTLVRGIAVASAVATAFIRVLTLIAWSRKYWSPMARVHYSAVALAAVLWVPYLTHWNLLGFGV
jgi:CubicO group peptidase (beta-lactamase class C family)